ncbi:MAG: hypothetical protein GY707_11180, partial [Desulfobacteraceae bacterium]|nr:hypothetical protein [Desulfobacteraceae bacterium]
QNRARKKAATVRKTAPKVTKPPKVKIDKSIKKLVPMPTKETKMVTKSTETILERGERKTLDGYPVKEWINHPIWSIPVDRSEICNIEWWVPRNFMNDDRELAGTFAVKLIKDGAVISEINSSGIAFDSSSQKCTLPWSIRNSIPDGGNYKIGIIARPPKQVKPPSFSGNQNIEGYYITNSRTFSIYDGSFQIHEPRHVGYGRSNPIDITFGVPGKFERRDGQLDATFKVELLKDGAIVAQIPVRGSSYNSSTNVFTFPWLIGPEIVNGWGYKIKVTLRPYSREYEGSFTAISRDDFGIISGTSRGSSDVFTIYSPRASERYKIGDTIPVKYTIDSPPQWGGRSPSMIKIQLEKYGSSYATSGVVHEWIEFVPERVRIDGRYNVYVNNITIPDNSSILPGTYGIIIKNPDSEHITTGFSEHFTIYKDRVTKPHIHGIRDDLLNDPFEIVLPGISLDTWIVENQQTIEWKYDPDLGDVDWTVTIDHGSNGTQVYTVEPDVIETAYNGTATARFTLPRVFGTGARAFEYSLVKVTGRLPAGPQISETRVVAIKRSIEIQVPNNSTEYLSVSENPHRVDWFVNNADVRRVNIALVNGFNRTIIGSNITVRQGYNHFEWCVACGASIDEIKDLTGSGYTVQVIDLDNRNLYDDSATFRIVD